MIVMASPKFCGLSLSSMDAVNCAPFIKWRDLYGGRGADAKHLFQFGFRLRVRARGVLWSPPVTVREANGAGISRTRRTPIESERRDSISLLNERIRREHCKRESQPSRPAMDAKEADMYIQKVKEQQQRGLQKLKGERVGGDASAAFSYKVDPYSLRSGDYVVHKKVGIGRFVGIKYDVPKGASSEPTEYVFIEYADGMAKLPVKQASRMLYRYNL